jgi:flagellar protein FlaJ
MGEALSSGEDEKKFLARESQMQGEAYRNEYEREVEALKRWTDAYVALIVAAGLIVIVAVISMMIYQVGIFFVVGLALGMVAVSCLGAWIIYVSVLREIKTRSKGPSSKLQKWVARFSTVTMATAAVEGALMLLLRLDIGWILLAIAAIIFPIGFLMRKDDGNITKKDEDMATVVRVLGNVMATTGTTIVDALNKVDRRSMGHMEPEISHLRLRIKAGIHPDMCWNALVEETGSELVERSGTLSAARRERLGERLPSSHRASRLCVRRGR